MKVSHSLQPDVVERLKDLAYWERVSESSIIEFLLREFLSLGDNAALGAIIKESVAARRRRRFAARREDADADSPSLRTHLSAARRSFADAVEVWKRRTTLANFNRVGVARLELAAARARAADAGIVADVESL